MAVARYLTAPLAALLLSVTAFSAPAQADETASKQFDLSGFTRITLKGSSGLRVVQGKSFAVVASGPAKFMPYVTAEVHGDTLELSVDDEGTSWFGIITISSDPEIEYRVTLPKIESLEVNGSGEVLAGTLESESLDLRVTGSGEMRIDKVAAEKLDASVTGSGDLLLGTALVVEGRAAITGSGDLRLDRIAGERFDASITGSGDMAVAGRVAAAHVKLMGSGDFLGRELLADDAGGRLMGSGDIVIRRPGRDSFSVMGSGDIALVD